MPNWCENELDVTGDETSLREFREYTMNKGKLLDMDRFIPYPEKFRKLDRVAREYEKAHPNDWKNRPKDGFNSGGYEWCVANRGTKWGFVSTTLQTEAGCLHYAFETAWSPPCPVILKMSEMFPDLTFELRYYEGGCAFQGTYITKAGEEVKDDCFDYDGDRGG